MGNTVLNNVSKYIDFCVVEDDEDSISIGIASPITPAIQPARISQASVISKPVPQVPPKKELCSLTNTSAEICEPEIVKPLPQSPPFPPRVLSKMKNFFEGGEDWEDVESLSNYFAVHDGILPLRRTDKITGVL